MKAAGWTYGETKSEGARTHPNLVPYDQLPVDQKAKVDLFIGVVAPLAVYFN